MESSRSLPLDVLQQKCAEHSTRFFRQEPYNPRFCFEIFRRAIVERNEEAWDIIYHQYRPLLDSWFRRHPLGETFRTERDELVLRAFERFWQAVSPEKFSSFPGLAGILRYLQLCIHATLTDAMRYRQRNNLLMDDGEEMLRQHVQNGGENTLEALLIQRERSVAIWQWVERHCNDQREIMLMYESLVLGFSPTEMCEHHPTLFSGVEEVYRLKAKVLKRLRRSADMPQGVQVAK